MATPTPVRTLPAALAAAALAGCASYAPPSVDVAEVKVGQATADGVVLDIGVDAVNTNPVELPLREVRYTLTLGGVEVFRGTRSPEATLRRLGTQRISFPAALPRGGGFGDGPVPYIVEGTLDYLTPGEIREILYDEGLLRPSVSFRSEGVVDFGAGG